MIPLDLSHLTLRADARKRSAERKANVGNLTNAEYAVILTSRVIRAIVENGSK